MLASVLVTWKMLLPGLLAVLGLKHDAVPQPIGCLPSHVDEPAFSDEPFGFGFHFVLRLEVQRWHGGPVACSQTHL